MQQKLVFELLKVAHEVLSAKDEWVTDSGKQYRFNSETGRFHDRSGEPVNNQGLHDRLLKKRKNAKFANQATAGDYDYQYDPKHEHHPKGPGWEQTDAGWRKTTSKPAIDTSPKPKPTSTKVPRKLKKFKPVESSLNPVQHILRDHEMKNDSNEVHELAGFKHSIMHHQRLSEDKVKHMRAEGTPFWPRNAAKLKAAFLHHMSPANYESPEAFGKAKERMKAMPVNDFAKVLAAIMSEEDEKTA